MIRLFLGYFFQKSFRVNPLFPKQRKGSYNLPMILLVGASASGKTEIAKYLASHFGITKAITHTTRPMREGEKNGVDYFFVRKQEFLNMEMLDQFVETTFYNGNLYGCSKSQVADDKCVVVDPAGLDHFLALGSSHIVAFYLEADEDIRRERMLGRGDKPQDVEKRIENDRLCFNDEVKEKANVIIPILTYSVEELATSIYEKYQKILANLN